MGDNLAHAPKSHHLSYKTLNLLYFLLLAAQQRFRHGFLKTQIFRCDPSVGRGSDFTSAGRIQVSLAQMTEIGRELQRASGCLRQQVVSVKASAVSPHGLSQPG